MSDIRFRVDEDENAYYISPSWTDREHIIPKPITEPEFRDAIEGYIITSASDAANTLTGDLEAEAQRRAARETSQAAAIARAGGDL